MGQLNEPRWLRGIVLGCVLAVAAFGAVGLLLADVGFFEPALWPVLGLLAFLGLLRLARPLARAEGHVTEASKVGAGGAIVIALLSMLWNGVNAARHVQINRVGAALSVNAGKWIAKHGTLSVRPFAAPFTSSAPFTASSTGMKLHGNHLEFDGSHMLSAILAEAQNIGGNRLMFLIVPILGGVSLLVFYLVAARLLRHPFAALAATATLAFLMPQISFSRDSTSEIPTQVLLFTAIWLLCDRRTLRSWGTGFCAGLLLGLLQAIQGDGVAFLLGVPILFAILWLRAKRADRRLLKRGFIGCGSGIGAGLALAAVDFAMWNRSYLSTLQVDLERLAVAFAIVIAGSVAAVALARRPDRARRLRSKRERASTVAAVLVVLFGFGAWLIRPLVQHVHAGKSDAVALVQRLNNLSVDPTRRYAELSVRWISWYIGPLTLILGIVGAAALARCFVRGNLRVPQLTTAAILAPVALLYIWSPSVAPDQVWASRRFLPAAFPGLILLAFGVLCVFARDRSRPGLMERRIIVVILAVAAVAYPLYTVRDLTQMTDQRGLFPVITDACRLIGPKGAVVMLEESRPPVSIAYLADPQTLRSFCDVPVIVLLGRPRPVVLRTLASEWSTAGRKLFVVAEHQETIREEFPSANIQPTVVGEESHMLEPTLQHPPSRYTSDQLHTSAVTQLMIAAVPRATRNLSPAG